jgi:cytochrome oxidase Cu insertion factor (SCO1/SenC/PrrC family)
MMTGSSIKVWLLLTCLLAAIYGSFVVWRRERSQQAIGATTTARRADGDANPAAPLEDFVLTDQDGNEFGSASLRGKVWVGSFFFTNCPAVCWRLNQTLAAVQETSPSSDTRFISITCDPDNDSPPVLAKYAQHFKADPERWTFLTGDMNLIRRIGNEFFQVAVENETHSDRAFVVDRSGQVRGRFRLTQPDQVQMLKELLTAVEAEPFVQREWPVADEPTSATSTPPADEPNGDQDRGRAENESAGGL